MTQRIAVAAAVLVRGNAPEAEIFTARRTEPPHLAGGWEFPGGKVDDDDPSIEYACRREIREELGVEIDVLAPLPGPLPDGAWPMGEDYALNVFICRIQGDAEPQLLEQHDDMTWVSIDDAERVAWLPVDLPPLRAAIQWVRSHL